MLELILRAIRELEKTQSIWSITDKINVKNELISHTTVWRHITGVSSPKIEHLIMYENAGVINMESIIGEYNENK